MKNHQKVLAVLTAVTLLGSYGVAFAQTTDGQGTRPPAPHAPGTRGPGGMMASTTWRQGMMGSTTGMRPGMREGSSTEQGGRDFRGIPGVITEIDADHFIMGTHGFGKASTTVMLTVNVNGSTQYQHGSTTAAYSDLTVGSRVMVQGTVATSTKTVTAARVLFGIGTGVGGGQGGPHLNEGSTTGQQGPRGMLERIKNFFGLGHASSTAGGPAAAGSSGFFGSVFQTLLGWMH